MKVRHNPSYIAINVFIFLIFCDDPYRHNLPEASKKHFINYIYIYMYLLINVHQYVSLKTGPNQAMN